MTYEQIAEMMEEMGLPFAYHHFAEDESPAPPFLLFLSPGENTFSADNLAYFSCKQLDIELYTDKKQPELEEQVESVLSQHEIYYLRLLQSRESSAPDVLYALPSARKQLRTQIKQLITISILHNDTFSA